MRTLTLKTKIEAQCGLPNQVTHRPQTPRWCASLARIEFMLSTSGLGIHPLAFAHHDEMREYLRSGTLGDGIRRYQEAFSAADEADIKSLVEAVERRAWAYDDKRGLFIDKLGEVGLMRAAIPSPSVLVRLSDFKLSSTESSWVAPSLSLWRRTP